MDQSIYRYRPRPHILLPHTPASKSPDLIDEWQSYSSSCSSSISSLDSCKHSLASSEPMISTTFPSLSNSTPLYPSSSRSRTLSNIRSPPEIIHIPERSKRSISITFDTRTHSRKNEENDDLMGDFLKGLTTLDDEVACGSAESIKTLHYYI
ncbi:hypothetical protein BY458DRAFT_430654 [Sporodiniella umbellata]|nr:hypothetical protein BY458DRAFT_430654 [Sporodiniella umbellata]